LLLMNAPVKSVCGDIVTNLSLFFSCVAYSVYYSIDEEGMQ
jgi:hypothetical protein